MKEFPITFEQFKSHIDHATAILALQDALYLTAHEFNEKTKSEMPYDIGYFPTLIDDVIALLEILTDDKENHWITYWFFDLDCGRKYKDGCITDADGKNIKAQTIEDLWDILISGV